MKSSLKFEQLAVMNCHYARHSFSYFLDCAVENGISNVEIWAQPFFIEAATATMSWEVKITTPTV